MNVLITGGAGFIGSNFVRYLLEQTEHRLINLDKLTYAGHPENLEEVRENPRHHFIQGDICDRALLRDIFEQYSIDRVVNFAAESHVDRSIEDPEVFLMTNVVGTQALLDTARDAWRLRPEDGRCREYRAGVKFLQVSTDEVYGSLGKEGFFTETSVIAPNSPYSASKASADLMVRAYHETFGLPMNITRCSNNYGPYQFPEKLIPLMIMNARADKSLPVYGDGMQIRDWLHVQDHCSAIATVLAKGLSGEVYNIGGNNEKANIEIVERILSRLDKPKSLIAHVADRLGHDRRYAIDNTKITTMLGWKPAYTFEQGIAETIDWYLANDAWVASVMNS